MGIRDVIEEVLTKWPQARTEPFGHHPLAAFLRGQAASEISSALVDTKGLTVKGSAGAGRWANVPWISVFDDVVTDSATRGYYVVYLFNADGSAVHLSLNQGTTATRAEFGNDTASVLQDRAALMRRRLPDYLGRLPVLEIDLKSGAQLPADYCAGHALGSTYQALALPSNETLVEHLQLIVGAYKALTFRGGLDPSPEASEDDPPSISQSLVELRRYKMHRRIERNPKAGKAAKRYHGYRCQACDMSFEEHYGPLGKDFIEAHHLLAISSLEEGIAVTYDLAEDFAVLCSNCHRMIHRTEDPSDMQLFRKLREQTALSRTIKLGQSGDSGK